MNILVRAMVIAIVAAALFSCSKETNPPTSATVIKPAATIQMPPKADAALQKAIDSSTSAKQNNQAKNALASDKPSSASSALADKKTIEYVVKKGDSLWKVAKHLAAYKDAHKWPLIYRANLAKIKDADLIRPGMKLKINLEPTDQEVKAAIAHAKTRGGWDLHSVEKSDIQYISHIG